MTYTPMQNDRRGFSPMDREWNYILDSGCAETGQWRDMVVLSGRPFTWPYRLHTDRSGHAYGSARLAPDWCFYSWGNEYVLADWDPETEHAVNCRLTLERRYAPKGETSGWPENPFAGDGNERWRNFTWRAEVTLNLLTGRHIMDVQPCGAKDAPRAPYVPADVTAEGTHKAGKLLAFFRAECAHWQAGDQPRPVQAHDLYGEPARA